MARVKDKQNAIKLRLEGKSYSQIKSELGISKSTLSGWLKDYPLSEEDFQKLQVKERRIETYKQTCKKRKDKILKEIYNSEKKKVFPLSKRDLCIAGLFLYWGEGGKTQEYQLNLSNTNPSMIKFYLYWLENSHFISRDKIRIKLHLYKDMNINKEIKYWSSELKVPVHQFEKPYIKDSAISRLTYKNGFGHGTCNIRICNGDIAKRVLVRIKILEDYFGILYK